MKMKTGKWSDEENRLFIENVDRMNEHELSLLLNRSVESIRKAKKRFEVTKTKVEIEQEVQRGHQWEWLKTEFTGPEIEYFKKEYANLSSQFRGDILPVEENELFMLIKTDILMHRLQEQMRKGEDQLLKVRDIYIKALTDSEGTEQDKEKLTALNTHMQSLENANRSLLNHLINLKKSYQDSMKNLKATRDQRLAKSTDKNTNFADMLKYINDEKNRKAEGEWTEMFRKGIAKQKTKLTEYHQYADGEVDKPIFNTETDES